MIRAVFKNSNYFFLVLLLVASVVLNAHFIFPKISFDVPSFDPANEEESLVETSDMHSVTVVVGKGDTLFKVLHSVGIDSIESQQIVDTVRTVFNPSGLKMGTKITIEPVTTDSETGDVIAAHPEKIVLALDDRNIVVKLDDARETFLVKEVPVELMKQTKFVKGTIDGSLYAAAKTSGADTNIIMSFINLYSYSTDFQRDVKTGDAFKIFYEYKTDKTGRKIRDPKILYASLNTGGQNQEIYLYENSKGKLDYYSPRGESVRRALLTTPVNGARITSGYGVRKHPVLGFSKMHKGLDYGAPKGTPILAAGDGVVSFVKTHRSGYGKHVKIRHNDTYSTLYGHMSKFAVKAGARVSQGQVIGYVGATGMATGPHLHYEVIQHGKKVNPKGVSFPKVPPLKGTELANFKKSIVEFETMIAGLENQKREQVAQLTLKNVFDSL
jgi:murein DD-endopeptidase MepM/ murein hydrolase activator NlpD